MFENTFHNDGEENRDSFLGRKITVDDLPLDPSQQEHETSFRQENYQKLWINYLNDAIERASERNDTWKVLQNIQQKLGLVSSSTDKELIIYQLKDLFPERSADFYTRLLHYLESRVRLPSQESVKHEIETLEKISAKMPLIENQLQIMQSELNQSEKWLVGLQSAQKLISAKKDHQYTTDNNQPYQEKLWESRLKIQEDDSKVKITQDLQQFDQLQKSWLITKAMLNQQVISIIGEPYSESVYRTYIHRQSTITALSNNLINFYNQAEKIYKKYFTEDN